MAVTIRPAEPGDFDYLMVLNESAVPEVNRLAEGDLSRLLGMADYCRVIEQDDEDAGFLLGLTEGADYQSLNYRWFASRYERFAYIDRVIIDAANRGQGLGTALYDDFETWARLRQAPLLACEVNTRPPNEPSRAFHAARGFVEIGTQHVGEKVVSLMIKQL